VNVFSQDSEVVLEEFASYISPWCFYYTAGQFLLEYLHSELYHNQSIRSVAKLEKTGAFGTITAEWRYREYFG